MVSKCSDIACKVIMCHLCLCVFSSGTTVDQVKVKQEPGVEEECSYSGANVKTERTKDGRRSACMVIAFSLQFS